MEADHADTSCSVESGWYGRVNCADTSCSHREPKARTQWLRTYPEDVSLHMYLVCTHTVGWN